MDGLKPNRFLTAVIVLSSTFCLFGPWTGQVEANQQSPEQIAPLSETANLPVYGARRSRLLETCRDGIILIPSQLQTLQGMRANLNFIYLTGPLAAEAVLVLDPAQSPHEILFWRQTIGPRGTPGGSAISGLNESPELLLRRPDFTPTQAQSVPERQTKTEPSASAQPSITIKPMEELTSFLRAAASRASRLYVLFSDFDFLSRTFGPTHPFSQSESIFNIDPVLAEMRLTKDEVEVQALREAINITVEALNETYRSTEPGMREIDLAAILKYTFNRRDTRESFLQAASGPNSTNIHFGATTRVIQPGDMIVIDVGAYSRGYTSDITRTIPASGHFTKEQRTIYELVLKAQKEGCRKLIPGVTFKVVQDEVEKILLEGLEKLGLVTDVNSWWQRRLYIQHGFGHGIGLDVHDSWAWHSRRLDKVVMVPGMVMTMEPGLYFPANRLDSFLASLQGKVAEAELAAFKAKVEPVYACYAGMGVRIEDDILITAQGNEILSAGVPKDVADIEKLMREKSPHNLLK